jgi:FtsP/CotA-like multicopper oxidase with cupredoxin domain
VGPGESKPVDFIAPAPGTYLFHDTTDAPVNRVLGLYGALVVVPAGRDNWWTFKDGEAEFERQWLWLLADIDPEWSRLARMGVTIDPVKTPLLPRYFTINDRAGVFSLAVSPDAAENRRTHEDTKPSGFQRNVDVRDTHFSGDVKLGTGQLIRIVNAGVAVHQPHFHGNHVWTQAINNVVLSRSNPVIVQEGHIALQHWEDVVEMDPLNSKAVMLPIKPPPDVIDQVRQAQQCDWIYPMHCHAEMSQTAGGGLYPGGQVSDWVLKP